jgi:hypothetical protein
MAATVPPRPESLMSPLARHAVVLVHGLDAADGSTLFDFVTGPPVGDHEATAGEAGVAEEGDLVACRSSPLADLRQTRIQSVTWNHDPEATVLSQQPDAPALGEGSAVTDFYQVCCSSSSVRPDRLRGRAGSHRSRAEGFNRADDPERFGADRDAVVELIEALQQWRDPHGPGGYDRLTLVGHRGGGPVAAAALQTCWQQRGQSPTEPAEEADPGAQDEDVAIALEDVVAARIAVAALAAGSGDPALAGSRGELRQAQAALYRLLCDDRRPRRRWLVADLVTLGYPARLPPVELPPAVRWTNAWFRQDGRAGPVPVTAGSAVDDIALGGSRLGGSRLGGSRLGGSGPGGLALGGAPSYWAESARRSSREGSRLSIALLRRLVRRRPTLLLGTRRPPDQARLAALSVALEQAARYPTARGAVLADVRLVVGADPAMAIPWPCPVRPLPVPALIALREVRGLLGPGGWATVLLSSDLLPTGVDVNRFAAGPVDRAYP